MNYLDLPPFPAIGDKGSQVCEAVRFYLAIIDELSPKQVRILSEHVKTCAECAEEHRLLQRATRLASALPESTPSARVDAAILAALHDRQRPTSPIQLRSLVRTVQTSRPLSSRRTRTPGRHMGMLALVAALLVLLGFGFFLRGLVFPAPTQAFALPNNLSWSGYVLHYTQTRMTDQGKAYQVEIYQNLGTNSMHIESSMPGTFDVVVVTSHQQMLGKDMMHRVAQQGTSVEDWAADGSLFDLAILRQELAAQRAHYLGTATFQGQSVYQIRVNNDQTLLLNMRYLPVNVLNSSSGLNAQKPLYQICALLSYTQALDPMWDMQVPPDFHMGELPARS